MEPKEKNSLEILKETLTRYFEAFKFPSIKLEFIGIKPDTGNSDLEPLEVGFLSINDGGTDLYSVSLHIEKHKRADDYVVTFLTNREIKETHVLSVPGKHANDISKWWVNLFYAQNDRRLMQSLRLAGHTGDQDCGDSQITKTFFSDVIEGVVRAWGLKHMNKVERAIVEETENFTRPKPRDVSIKVEGHEHH